MGMEFMTWRDQRLVPVRARRTRKLLICKPANDNADQVADDAPKQPTRLIKAVCQADHKGQQCGYVARVTRKWVVQLGAPHCPVHGAMNVDELSRAKGMGIREKERRALGVEDALAALPHLTEAMLVALGKAGIKTLDDLAELASDELIATRRERSGAGQQEQAGILARFRLTQAQGDEIIMAARAHWFVGEEA